MYSRIGAWIGTLLPLTAGLLGGPAMAQVPPPRHPPRRPPRIIRPIRPPRPFVRTESTRVTARIVDGVCDTTVALRFRNEGGRIGEKILILPLPEGASADKLEMLVGGKLQAGEILDKDKARRIYESIVRRRRDPALLEYMGRDVLRLRVFPIPPKGSQEVKVRFRLLLPESGGLYRYEFPTRAVEGGSFSLDVKIESRKAIKNVYSPLQGMDVSRKDDHAARASFESKGRPQRDPVLFYGLSDRDFGLNLLSYRKQGQDGYFLLMLAPKRDWEAEKELEKSITFVLDTSGSMQGEKIQQAKGALRFFLKSLKPADRFNLIPFSTEARPFAQSPVQATPEKVEEAYKFVAGIEARGGTNIEEALRTALGAEAQEGLVPMVVFLTDGLPTVGQTNPKDILKSSEASNRAKARIFVFGVGNDVNTQLLDKLSQNSGGTRDYVRPSENLEVKVSALFEKLAHPVMTDVELGIEKVSFSRMSPKKLPDLFRGGRLVVLGRYQGEGAVAIRLKGKVGGSSKEFVYDASFKAQDTQHDFVATLWAQRRIGQLLDAIRLSGRNPELVAEVQRIGREHGIVTPYTSHIIVEEGERVARQWRRRPNAPAAPRRFDRDRVQRELERAGVAADKIEADEGKRAGEYAKKARGRLKSLGEKTSGAGAVADSKNAARMLYLQRLDGRTSGRLWRNQRIGDRVFHFVGGVWIDSGYKKEMEKGLEKIKAFSPEYFELLRAHPKLAKLLSFSTAMVIVIGPNAAVEITP